MMTYARIRFWLAYAAILTIVVSSALEGAVRILGIAPTLPEQYSKQVSDPYLPWKSEPSSIVEGRTPEFSYSYRHDSQGFRDVEHEKSKPPGTFRILVLGDSFTYGVGAAFEETYPSRLQQILNEHFNGQPRIEVINRGMGRYWPEPERILLERYGLAYAPDLVLVAFLPNDILDTNAGINALEVNQGFLVTRGLDPLGGIGTWLYLHSRAFRMLFYRYLTVQLAREKSRTVTPDAAEIYKADGIYESDWRRVELEYDRMLAHVSKAGAKFGLIYIPQSGPWPPSRFPYAQQRLAAWSGARRVTFVNSAPDLQAAAGSGVQVYYPQDGHCTPAGYGVIARATAARLLDSPFTPLPHVSGR